jgi:hypothetical protein
LFIPPCTIILISCPTLFHFLLLISSIRPGILCNSYRSWIVLFLHTPCSVAGPKSFVKTFLFPILSKICFLLNHVECFTSRQRNRI